LDSRIGRRSYRCQRTGPRGDQKIDRRRRFRHGGFDNGYFAHPRPATPASVSTHKPATTHNPNPFMLYTLALILIIAWLLGLVSSYTMGGFIHILLVIAIILVLVRLIQGKKI
jgi:hypothetical protein